MKYGVLFLLLWSTVSFADENTFCHYANSQSATCMTKAWDTYYDLVKQYVNTLQEQAREEGSLFDQAKTIQEFEREWPFSYFHRTFVRCGSTKAYETDAHQCLIESAPTQKINQVLRTSF